jgi:hypothetical protein
LRLDAHAHSVVADALRRTSSGYHHRVLNHFMTPRSAGPAERVMLRRDQGLTAIPGGMLS